MNAIIKRDKKIKQSRMNMSMWYPICNESTSYMKWNYLCYYKLTHQNKNL